MSKICEQCSLPRDDYFNISGKICDTCWDDNAKGKNQYKVIECFSLANLQNKVTDALKIGWKLQGGINVVSSETLTSYYQSMVK